MQFNTSTIFTDNSLGAVPEHLSNIVVDLVKHQMVLALIPDRESLSELQVSGDKVFYEFLESRPPIQTITPGQPLVFHSPSMTNKGLNINIYVGTGIVVDALNHVLPANAKKKFELFKSSAVFPLISHQEKVVAETYVGFKNSIVATGANGEITPNDLTEVKRILQEELVWGPGGFGVISTYDEKMLVNTALLTEYQKSGSRSALVDAFLAKLRGFNIFGHTELIKNQLTTPSRIVYNNIFGVPGGIKMAIKSLDLPGITPGASVIEIRDKKTNTLIRQTIWYDPNLRKFKIMYEILMGILVLHPERMVHVQSTETIGA